MSPLRLGRMPLVWLLLWLCLWSCGTGSTLSTDFEPEGPVDCRLEFDATEVGLLQPVRATLWLYVEAEAAPPSWPATSIPEGFTGEVTAEETEARGKGYLLRRVLSLRPTSLGEVSFPSLSLEVEGHKTSTPAQTFVVGSVLRPEDDQAVLEDPVDPFEPVVRWWLWSALCGGVLAVLAALFFFLRARRRRAPPMPVEVPVLPHVKAMRALAKLRQADRTTGAQIEQFYVGVSQVLRDYLEERFGLHAPQRSTEEFLVELERGEALTLSHRQSLRQFLQQCDLVKFAKVIPGVDVHEQTLRIAENVVEETRSDGPDPVHPGGASRLASGASGSGSGSSSAHRPQSPSSPRGASVPPPLPSSTVTRPDDSIPGGES